MQQIFGLNEHNIHEPEPVWLWFCLYASHSEPSIFQILYWTCIFFNPFS